MLSRNTVASASVRTAVVAVVAAVAIPAGAAAAVAGTARQGAAATTASPFQAAAREMLAAAEGRAPSGVNPYLAVGARPVTPNRASWRQFAGGAVAPSSATEALPTTRRPEAEPAAASGVNDVPGRAESLPGLGATAGDDARTTVTGSFSAPPMTVAQPPSAPEDNGAIQLAADTGVSAASEAARIPGIIGDGPHGSAGTGTGDFDFYTMAGAAADPVLIEVTTPTGGLAPIVFVIGPDGEVVLAALDLDRSGVARVRSRLPATGTYTVAVGGCCVEGLVPADPTDPASGPGVATEGPYELLVALPAVDSDSYSVTLGRGEVLGTTVSGPAYGVDIYDPAGRLVGGSAFDTGLIYPAASPLPRGGVLSMDHVAAVPGRHTVVFRGRDGAYTGQIAAVRPARKARPAGPVQTVFLDTDGATIDLAIFGGPSDERTLSPLAGFLPGWGLTAEDEARVVAVMADTVRRVLNRTLASAPGAAAGVRVVTSRDAAGAADAEPWGQPGVSRVIVGGSIAESGLPTIGLAQSIDPGNFAREETAVLLLDLLSDPAPSPYSVNAYLGPDSDRAGFVGRVLGTIAAHEAGHYLGSWHTSNLDARVGVMDQGGGDFGDFFGVGPDRVGGTADDRQSWFRTGPFAANEALFGTEDTATRTAWGLVGGRRP